MQSFVTSPSAGQTVVMNSFLGWQCRTRQIAMRERDGRPDKSWSPDIRLVDGGGPLGQIVTLLCKHDDCDSAAELEHMARSTHDPAQRRSKAVAFLASRYYQDHREFSGALAASFDQRSSAAIRLCKAENCELIFGSHGHRARLLCRSERMMRSDRSWASCWWHNFLFNPHLPPDVAFIRFWPEWNQSEFGPEDRPVEPAAAVSGDSSLPSAL